MSDLAPDGSPVAFYRRLPPAGEPELIDGLLHPASTVLDLGCGAGRIAGPLAALGHVVTGVDNGPGMIAALPPGIEGIVGDATTIRLGRTFDAVLLASHLVNEPEAGPAFARTAATHLAGGGIVIGETYPPGLDPATGAGTIRRLGDAQITVVRAERVGDLLIAEVRYGVHGERWMQSFVARVLDEEALRFLLADAGLHLDRWLERPGWFVAVPRTADSRRAAKTGSDSQP